MSTENPGVSPDDLANISRAKLELEQTFDAVTDLIFIVDRTCSIVRVNRAMADRCGCAPSALIGRKCFDVIHGLSCGPDFCPHDSLLEFHEPQTAEFESSILHGIFEVTMSPVLDTSGQVMASVHIARDVTDKRRIEQALQESEQLFSVFMKNLPLAVTIKDQRGRYLFVNEYLEDLLGAKNLIGLTAQDLLPADVALKMAHDDREALSQGLGLYNDSIKDSDGNEIALDTYKFPIPRVDGTTLLGTISVDVTEKKRHEELLKAQQHQLEEINSSLESRIESAVAEIRNKDNLLIQQSRLSAMSEMISNIAHQWRQPLNNIGLIVQGLRLAIKSNDLTEQELDEDIDDTMRVLQQISETIDDFRNFFSYEEEKDFLFINELVSRALSFVESSLKCKGIKIKLDEQPDVTAEGYPNEYVQVLLNVIMNARDVLLEHQVGNPTVAIRIFKENGRSIVTVRDNGGGIRDDVLPKIFDPYFTTKQQGKGTGIGLYMSKMIIEKKMHGSLTACNVDNGAEFRIEL